MRFRRRAQFAVFAGAGVVLFWAALSGYLLNQRYNGYAQARIAAREIALVLAAYESGRTPPLSVTQIVTEKNLIVDENLREQVLPLPLTRQGTSWPASISLFVDGPFLPERVLITLNNSASVEDYLDTASRALIQLGARSGLLFRLGDGKQIGLEAPTLWRPRLPIVGLGIVIFFSAAIVVALLATLVAFVSRPVERMSRILSTQRSTNPLRNVDEIRQIEKAYQKVLSESDERERDRIHSLAAMSHDLHTPFTRLRLKTELMVGVPEKQSMLNDLDEIDEMLSETLRYLRGEDAGEPFQRLDFGALVETVCHEYQDMGRPVEYHPPPPLMFNEISTVFRARPDHPHGFEDHRRITIEGQPRGLRRSVTNLISNGLKYGKAVNVFLNATSDDVVLTVLDKGPGIPEDQQAEVLKPFYRAEASRGRTTGGTGLGLTVVQSVMDTHAGTLAFRNKPDGFEVCMTVPRIQRSVQ